MHGTASHPIPIVRPGTSPGAASAPSFAKALPFVAALVFLLALHVGGIDLSGPTATTAACAAILIFGLPHGTLDLELLKLERATAPARMPAVLALYLGLAGAMYLLWRTAPVAALVAFIAIAVVHFSEDWHISEDRTGSSFLAQGVALALLAAPAFLHRADLSSLFVALSGHPGGAVVADVMLLLAPVGLAVAAVALVSLYRAGHPDRAGAGMAAILGMALLPPAIGFAAFFCLFHSPRHLRAAVAMLSGSKPETRAHWWIVGALTLAAIGIAALLFTAEARADLPARIVAASFMTLSILTVPHMAVPSILRAWSRRVPSPSL